MKTNFIERWLFDHEFSIAFFSKVHLDLVNSRLMMSIGFSDPNAVCAFGVSCPSACAFGVSCPSAWS